MAEQEKKQEKKQKKEEVQKEKKPRAEEEYESLVRILTYDIPGSKPVFVGLTRIKGISWSIANVICKKLNLQTSKRISELSPEEIKKIEEFLKHSEIPAFLRNRQKDRETGQDMHLYGTDLDLRKEFDIKRLKKIRCLKGIRHSAGLPVRGQRTRSHFRTKGRKAVGVKRKSK